MQTQKEMFLEYVNDLEIQGRITVETRDNIIVKVLRGDYDDVLLGIGGVYEKD